MDKSVLGGGSKGLIQTIFNDFNITNLLILLIIFKQYVTEYMKISQYSVGISDLIADDKLIKKLYRL